MCRSIKQLRSSNETASAAEIEAAALQFVRKVSGYRRPSQKNAAAFDTAVREISAATQGLLVALGNERSPAHLSSVEAQRRSGSIRAGGEGLDAGGGARADDAVGVARARARLGQGHHDPILLRHQDIPRGVARQIEDNES